MLLRSLDRGDAWEEISPDLTTNDPVKIAGQGHIMYCTITTICESPIKAGVIWVGTDDGRIHLTQDHGARWEEMTGKLSEIGAPAHTWVSRIVASSHDPGTAFVCKSGYREDVFKPFIYRTRDLGETWEDIKGNLPDAPISVVFEDRINPDLLFVGNDMGVYFTLDGGENWLPLKNNMPPLPVRDLLVHPKTQDLVVGSYGRGVWVTNIGALQEISSDVINKDFYLFRILDRPINYTSQRAWWGNYHMTGDAHLRTWNEPAGMHIYYYIKEERESPLRLVMWDLDGNKLATLETKKTPGIHRVVWRAEKFEPGTYRIILTDGDKRIVKKGTLTERILWPVGNPEHLRKAQ